MLQQVCIKYLDCCLVVTTQSNTCLFLHDITRGTEASITALRVQQYASNLLELACQHHYKLCDPLSPNSSICFLSPTAVRWTLNSTRFWCTHLHAVRRACELGEVHSEARWGCDPETDRDDWGVEPAVFDTKGVHQHKRC